MKRALIALLALVSAFGVPAFSQTKTKIDTLTVGTENSVIWVDGVKFSGCPAAVTAAGTVNKTIIIIPSNGPFINCPASIPENITLWNFDGTRDWCNNAGGATPPCSGINWNYDDGNVYAGERHELTTNHQDLNGVTLGSYSITNLKNATANGSSGADGFSAECDTAGTLSGAFNFCTAHEANVSVGSTGGSFAALNGVTGSVNTSLGSTTTVTTIRGLWGIGCNGITALNKPVNCYGIDANDQSAVGTKATGRAYSVFSRGRSLFGFSSSTSNGGFDAEDHLNVVHPLLTIDGSDNTVFQAISSAGLLLQDSGSNNQLQISNSLGVTPFTKLSPRTAAAVDVGNAALPFGNLWIGTAATNNFKFQPAATAAARVISMPDPLGAVNMPYVIASGTTTLTANATLAAVTSQAVNTTAATGTLTTDSIEWAYATAPGAGDSLCHVSPYVTAGNVNFVRTNPTAAAQNVAAIVINWRVIR